MCISPSIFISIIETANGSNFNKFTEKAKTIDNKSNIDTVQNSSHAYEINEVTILPDQSANNDANGRGMYGMRSFGNETEFNSHMVLYGADDLHQCLECEDFFFSHYALQEHHKVHFADSMIGGLEDKLDDREITSDDDDDDDKKEKYWCYVCDNTFEKALDLIAHAEIHQQATVET